MKEEYETHHPLATAFLDAHQRGGMEGAERFINNLVASHTQSLCEEIEKERQEHTVYELQEKGLSCDDCNNICEIHAYNRALSDILALIKKHGE